MEIEDILYEIFIMQLRNISYLDVPKAATKSKLSYEIISNLILNWSNTVRWYSYNTHTIYLLLVE